MTPHFQNDKIEQIANDCGLYISEHNVPATEKEIEFFVEQIIHKCYEITKDERIVEFFGIKK